MIFPECSSACGWAASDFLNVRNGEIMTGNRRFEPCKAACHYFNIAHLSVCAAVVRFGGGSRGWVPHTRSTRPGGLSGTGRQAKLRRDCVRLYRRRFFEVNFHLAVFSRLTRLKVKTRFHRSGLNISRCSQYFADAR